jgi:hypothetical protein
MPRPLSRSAIMLLLMMMVMTEWVPALCGCAPRSATPAQGIHAVWPFWPTQMRIHPLTRIIRDEERGALVLEARIEFTDREGSTSKAAGQLTLTLHESARDRRVSEPVQVWNQNLSDLNVNRRQYDEVTRKYLFRLELDESKLPQQPDLRAYMLSDDGQELRASMTVSR